MLNQTPKRSKINDANGIADGAGLGVTLGSIGLLGITSVMNLYTSTKPPHGKNGRGECSINIHINPVFVFEAGYEIAAEYMVNVEATADDINGIESMIKAIENNPLSLSIKHQPSEDLPYNNWVLTATDETVLKEIEDVSDDCPPVERLFKVGDPIVFNYDMSVEAVAYGLEVNLNPNRINVPKTGFTKEFLAGFYQTLRDEASLALSKTLKSN